MTWSDTLLRILKDNDIRLIAYVPDNVLTPLIAGVSADNYFLPVSATREDEAIGTATGAYMAGLRGAVKRAATAGASDIAAIARGAGIANSVWVRDQQHFEKCSIGVLTTAGRFCSRSRSTTSREKVRRRAIPRSFAAAS